MLYAMGKRDVGSDAPTKDSLIIIEIVRGGRFRTRPHADGLTGETREMQENGTPAKQFLEYSSLINLNLRSQMWPHFLLRNNS